MNEIKMFDELTEEQQEKAVDQCLDDLLQAIMEGLRFSEEKNGDTFQAAIDAAVQEAEDLRTPWFAHEYIMDARYFPGEGHVVEDDGLYPVAENLRGMARCDAEDALYPAPGQRCIGGIAG